MLLDEQNREDFYSNLTLSSPMIIEKQQALTAVSPNHFRYSSNGNYLYTACDKGVVRR
jgi:hypothetical protein